MYIMREASPSLLNLSKSYPVVVLTGPRQAGKSTLARHLFPEKEYVSLENLDDRAFATSDPKAFLKRYANGAILDEVQHCPDLLSYIQTYVDDPQQRSKMGLFILTGSAQLTLLSSVSQSLAGRAALLTLLPFSQTELQQSSLLPPTLEEVLWKGNYPPLYDRPVAPQNWYSNYLRTYVERDVRQILGIRDLGTFQKFLKMCAARSGQLLNLSSLASDCGISHSTASEWINILEATYIIFRIQPHFRNFSKRLIKTPKLYFIDSGLLCTLLEIENPTQLITHAQRGAIFEGWVISELLKSRLHQDLRQNLFFWRDHKGLEVDVVLEKEGKLIPIEIKSGQTIASDWFDALKTFCALAQTEALEPHLIFGGDGPTHTRNGVQIIPWNHLNKIG